MGGLRRVNEKGRILIEVENKWEGKRQNKGKRVYIPNKWGNLHGSP